MGDGFFSLESLEDGGVHVFSLRGELDVANAERVQQAILTATGSVVVDLSELTFIDSSGVTAIVHARDEVTGRGNGFELRGPKGNVRRVFEITGLSYLLG